VVDVADAESLARAMEGLLRDESKRIRLGRNARLTFEARFSLDTVAAKMLRVYEALSERSGKRGLA
jgi:glycosyltransferase involved in cell wall biosynthesis